MSVPLDPADLRPGDLVFLGARSGSSTTSGCMRRRLGIAAPHHGAVVSIEPLAAVPWDGFGRILRAPRGRIVSMHRLAGSDRRPVLRAGPETLVTPKAVHTSDAAAPTTAATPVPHRSPPPSAPPRRRHDVERLAALPREEFRHWGVSLLASFRGAGR